MIHLILDRGNGYTMNNYLGFRGESIRQHFKVTYYDELALLSTIDCSAIIFMDLERLNDRDTKSLISFVDYLDHHGGPQVLNRPSEVLNRFQMLRELNNQSINPHNVYELDEDLKSVSYPVFIRHKHNHTGALSPLIHKHSDIKKHLWPIILSGHTRHDLMVVEYVDTKNDHGVYLKFACMKIGNAILPKHIGIDDHWHVKVGTSSKGYNGIDYDQKLEEFMASFPHEAWAKKVFETAHIDYGRLDYALKDDQPVAWEINLNPDFFGRNQINQVEQESKLNSFLLDENHEDIRAAFLELAAQARKRVDLPNALLSKNTFGKSKGTRPLLKRSFQSIVKRFPILKSALVKYRSLIRTIVD